MRNINLNMLRRNIGYVGQEPILFQGSIEENIAYGDDEECTKEAVVAATKISHAHDFIEEFPEGYQTQVGERSINLSGGQKQRIAIARGIIGKPSILLMDEATSALDNNTEALVQASLDDLQRSQSFTMIVIAHRISTIRNADEIFVLNRGVIVEKGKYDDLVAMNGLFSELARINANL